jgi:hypothetical protein
MSVIGRAGQACPKPGAGNNAQAYRMWQSGFVPDKKYRSRMISSSSRTAG